MVHPLKSPNMKSILRVPVRWLAVAFGVSLLTPTITPAFPPAPHHRLFGLVKNEFGEPLEAQNAQIVFETPEGVRIPAPIVPGLEPGVNYQLNVAMDSGIAPDSYKPTALKPTLPFRILVIVGTTTYLPMEMTGTFGKLGEAAGSTRIDLTLGIDSDNDGLPDAWEQWLASQLGGGGLDGIRPGDDSDGDGISNRDEYLAGTFAFDPEGGFRLNLVPRAEGAPLLEFTVIKPRTYTVYASSDFQNWTPVPFRIAEEGPEALVRLNYVSTDVRILRVEPVLPVGTPTPSSFFKVQVQ